MPRITGTPWSDALNGTAGSDWIDGGGGDDVITGWATPNPAYRFGGAIAMANDGADVVHGGNGNDAIYGGAGRDVLYGDAGRDTLTGGADADTMTGGAGADTFSFGRAPPVERYAPSPFDTGLGRNADHITDFQEGLDKLDLRAYGAGGVPGQFLNWWEGFNDPSRLQVKVDYRGWDTVVQFHAAGQPAGVTGEIVLDGFHWITARDFLWQW